MIRLFSIRAGRFGEEVVSDLRVVWCAEIRGEDGAGDSDLGFSKWADKLRGGAPGIV